MIIFTLKRIILLFLFFNPFHTILYSQNNDHISYLTSKDSIDKIYGMDPSLYNGILYQPNYPKNVLSNQYFTSPDYLNGEVLIRGVIIKNIKLNYDIYNQKILLKYTNQSNGINIISISNAWLESFKMGDDRFIFFSTTEIPKRIYQVLGNGPILLLYYWKKELMIDNAAGVLNFITKKDAFLLMDNSLKKFNSNRNFLQLFTPDKQILIKKYLKMNKLKVNKASNKTMEELINFCNNPI